MSVDTYRAQQKSPGPKPDLRSNLAMTERTLQTSKVCVSMGSYPPLRGIFERGLSMKALAAVLIAVGVLFAIDTVYNDGRYSVIIEQAITNLTSHWWN